MIKNIKEQVNLLRRSNMIRHNYICSPLINYTQYGIEENCSYLDPDVFPKHDDNPDLSIADNISPRFVNFHEIVLALYRNELNNGKILNFNKILKQASVKYKEINKKEFEILKSFSIDIKPDIESEVDSSINPSIKHITFGSTSNEKELCIGLVNMKLNDYYIEQSYLQNPILDNKRREQFNSLLNLVRHTEHQIKRKIDILVLPELSVPYKALDWLCDYAQRNQLMMIFGVEHWVSKNRAYNLLATLIPFPLNENSNSEETFNGLLPLLRIKNHYAPDEELLLKSYRYTIPKPKPSEYFLIEWKGAKFSVFNCFELADIQHRALFRGEVDLLFACEYNADTHYYSNIVESVVRDLHCYFIQSNNAVNGDSRITRPTKSATMNQIQIKGGENISIIVDTIDIENIRNHQIQNNVGRDKGSFFKPTPPGYEVEKAMNRRGKNLNKK